MNYDKFHMFVLEIPEHLCCCYPIQWHRQYCYLSSVRFC